MGVTQQQIYDGLDLDLSWSEADLPERVRTKHVHRLHPYLGKYIPQLVEELFRRHVPARGRVLDPFAGSGTTLVQALESGLDSAGVDIAAFNCLLMRVKTGAHNPFVLERELRDVLARFAAGEGSAGRPSAYACRWFAPQACTDLLRFRSLIADYEHADVLRVVLARAARSARRTTHFDLDFPQQPQLEPYWCFKHRRECKPVERAEHFIRRYTLDTLERLKEFGRVRSKRLIDRAARRHARAGPARPVRCGRHLTAVSGTDRLPRAAPLRIRAARARRSARARDRCRGEWNVEGGAGGLHRRHRRRARSLRGRR